jgi:hypothetical protein
MLENDSVEFFSSLDERRKCRAASVFPHISGYGLDLARTAQLPKSRLQIVVVGCNSAMADR